MAESAAIKITRLEEQMTHVVTEIVEVKTLIKGLIDKIDQLSSLQNEVKVLRDEVDALKRRGVIFGFLFPTMGAAAGSILTVLILSYLDKLR